MNLTIHCLGLRYKTNVENIVSIFWEKAIIECVIILVLKVKVLADTMTMTKLWEKAIIEFGIKTSIVLKFHQNFPKLSIKGY